ncbi:TPA: hypothetical protein GX533_00730 [Candidatus Dojkabacteria bacterium]|uniref:EF-hand domain-containing protein n=1 Tax=Candidatus Dojkabacteria bacterium TaxID=2099670 RepID=A0A832R8H6_9BACT|nr:hypothetical protein [Candidatus Dojkabacteria bacterium]
MRDKKAIPFFVLSFLFLTAFSVLIYTVNRGDSFDSRSKASILELPEEYKKADFNGDGKVSMVDFGLWLTYFRNFKSNGYGYKEIDAGSGTTCSLDSNGQAYCWGYNEYGQLGNGESGEDADRNMPVIVKQGAIPSSVTLTSIKAGGMHTCGLGGNGKAYCWGRNKNGQLGCGDNADSNTPVAVKPGVIPSTVKLTGISTGYIHSCGLGNDGRAYCWGSNYYGALGNGDNVDSNTPVAVKLGEIPSTVKLISINTGSYHTCGLGNNGQTYCWGQNTNGQLGNGNYETSNIPVAVKPGAIPSTVKLTSIRTGGFHTCGLGNDGRAYCWGFNGEGALGNGGNKNSNMPVAVEHDGVLSGITLTSIYAGVMHTCGLGDNGQAYCWGWNKNGQLGDGSNKNSNTPVVVKQGEISSTVKLKSINAEDVHTCGLGDNGQTYCWGHNGFGQLGNGGNTSSNTPVEVKQGEYLLHGDLNDDSRISMEDFRIWLDIYRKCKDQP